MNQLAVAVIPAYNEAGPIGDVVKRVLQHVRFAVVVDDGSDDGTGTAARDAGAEVVRHPKRRGKGWAIRSGIAVLEGREHRYVLFLDADGQHDPDDAPALIRAAETRGYDLVIGRRALDPARGGVRYYTNLVGCNILSRWTGLEVLDSQSGYRLVRASSLEGLDLKSRGFEIETEMLLKLARRGARIGHVMVRSLPSGRSSRLRPVRDVTRICVSAVRHHYLGV